MTDKATRCKINDNGDLVSISCGETTVYFGNHNVSLNSYCRLASNRDWYKQFCDDLKAIHRRKIALGKVEEMIADELD